MADAHDQAIAAAARDLAGTDEMLEHHASTCESDPCSACDMWSHRTAEKWASLRARIAEADHARTQDTPNEEI